MYKLNKYNLYMNNIWKNRNNCRLCNSLKLNIFYKLNPTPLANNFSFTIKNQIVIPLDLCICEECKHVQLIQIVNPVTLYSNYLYVSSTSHVMSVHLEQNVLKFVKRLNLQNTDNILEVGANDGVCVKQLLKYGFANVIGIDPSININSMHNLPIICDFFNKNIIDKLNGKKFKLIFGFHCFAHIENIQEVFDTIYKLLDDDGTFIMEVGYFYQIFLKKCFDVIYHEHIDYHTCTAIEQFSKKYNLFLYDALENDIQGGSIQFYFSKNKNKKIENTINECKKNELSMNIFDIVFLNEWKNSIINTGHSIKTILNELINKGKIIVGYGAPAKLTTFLYQYELDNKIIKYIVDENPLKQNRFSPGTNIPIKSIQHLTVDFPDYIIIFSWNFADEIIVKLEKYRKKGGYVIIPFPKIKILHPT